MLGALVYVPSTDATGIFTTTKLQMSDAKMKISAFLGSNTATEPDNTTVDANDSKTIPIDPTVRQLVRGIRESTNRAVVVSAIVGEILCQKVAIDSSNSMMANKVICTMPTNITTDDLS